MSVIALLISVSILASVGDPVKDKKMFEKGLVELMKKKGGKVGASLKVNDCIEIAINNEVRVLSEDFNIQLCDNPAYLWIEYSISECHETHKYIIDTCLNTIEDILLVAYQTDETTVLQECPLID